MKKFWKENKELIAYITMMLAVCVLYFKFVLHKSYLLGNDQWFQYNIFYKEWVRLISGVLEGKGLPFYSWNMYLGTDFYSAMTYYCTGDVFLPILLLFKNNIELGLLIETFLCVYISAIAMNSYLNSIHIQSKSTRIFISLIYAIGAEAILYNGNYMFHRFYAFMPFLFSGLHHYFDENKTILFTCSITVLFLQNYYFMFPTLVFLLLYSIFYEIKAQRLNRIIWDFLRLLFSIVIGFLISGVILIPGIIYLLNNPRLSESYTTELFWNPKIYYGLLLSLISTNPINSGFSLFETYMDSHENWYNLLIGIIPLIGVFSFIKKKENRVDLIFLTLLLTILIIRPLNSIMHGFSIPSLRWVFLLEFILLSYGARGLDSNKEKSTRFSIVFFMVLVGSIISMFIKGMVYESNYIHIYYLLGCILINILIYWIFTKKCRVSYFISLIYIFCTLLGYMYFETRYISPGLDTLVSKYVVYAIDTDEDRAFRYYMSYKNNNPNVELNLNKSLDYQMMSIGTYCSTYDANIATFNQMSNSIMALDWQCQVDDPYANVMLGSKYYIVYAESDLPNELEFEYAYSFGDYSVYLNKNYLGFGYCANQVKYLDEFTSTKDYVESIMVDDKDIDISVFSDSKYSRLNVITRNNNSLISEITCETRSLLMIPIPNNRGWKIQVDGTEVDAISVNGGFIGIDLNEGYHYIEMYFIPKGLKLGVLCTAIGIVLLLVSLYFELKKHA